MINKKASSTSIGILVIGVFFTFGLILFGLTIKGMDNSKQIASAGLVETVRAVSEQILFYEKLGYEKNRIAEMIYNEDSLNPLQNYVGNLKLTYNAKEDFYIIIVEINNVKVEYFFRSKVY